MGMGKRRLVLTLTAAALALGACTTTATAPPPPRAQIGSFGFDMTGKDTTIRPGDDFYRYANGGWLANTPIPADKSNYGQFTMLDDLSSERVRSMLADLAANPPEAGTIGHKIGTYYASFMDAAAIEQAGLAPLAPALAAIAAARSPADFARLAVQAVKDSNVSPVFFYIGQDDKNPDRYIPTFYQLGLGLPNRDYYLEAGFADVRARYKQHIAAMLTLAGLPDGPAKAARVFALEDAIARAHWRKEDNRDPVKTYTIWSRADFDAKAPGFDWAAYFAEAGLAGEERFLITQPSALTGTVAALAAADRQTLQDYFAYHQINGSAPVLPKAFVDENFAMFGKTLSGTPELKERWKRAVDITSAAMGEAIGQMYVARYFPPEAKTRMDELVANVVEAYRQRISALDWMSAATKEKALAKLATFDPKIGYPSRWRDYSALDVRPGEALANAERAARFEYNRNLAKLGKPVDRTEWGMTPQTVNAYYNPAKNEIVFPAAILQPPFFDPHADDAINYGAIGAVIGHEIGHGFDDQGSQYGPDGSLANWWTDADRAAFNQRGNALVSQYNAYEPVSGHKINGRFTLGENIGDLGGVQAAYTAYQLSRGGKAAPVIEGLTGDQRFFLGWAQVWRRLYREQNLIQRLVTDPHSPSEFRVNGIVRNLDAWYAAYGIKPGDRLYLPPDQRVRIW